MTTKANEGEGSRTAARAYNKGVKDFEKTGQVEKKAREAADAVSGPEASDLLKAEAVGKSHSKGEDPLITKTKRTPQKG